MPYVSVVNCLFDKEDNTPKDTQVDKEVDTNKKSDKDTDENERH